MRTARDTGSKRSGPGRRTGPAPRTDRGRGPSLPLGCRCRVPVLSVRGTPGRRVLGKATRLGRPTAPVAPVASRSDDHRYRSRTRSFPVPVRVDPKGEPSVAMNVRFEGDVTVLSNFGRLVNDPRHFDAARDLGMLLDEGHRLFVLDLDTLREVVRDGPRALDHPDAGSARPGATPCSPRSVPPTSVTSTRCGWTPTGTSSRASTRRASACARATRTPSPNGHASIRVPESDTITVRFLRATRPPYAIGTALA